MNEALNEFATAFGSEHSPAKSKKGCVSRGGGGGESAGEVAIVLTMSSIFRILRTVSEAN